MLVENPWFSYLEESSYRWSNHPEVGKNDIDVPNNKSEQSEWDASWSWGARWLSKETVASMNNAENSEKLAASQFMDNATSPDHGWPPVIRNLESSTTKANIGWTEWRSDSSGMA
jgi:hypothetical protein